MLNKKQSANPHSNVFSRIKRGLSGYVSYLAACEMNSAFSEYILYEPILRILTTCGYEAICEKECPNNGINCRGDKKRIDFEASHEQYGKFVMEVKWARRKNLNVAGDAEKLKRFRSVQKDVSCYLCVFGRKSAIENLQLDESAFRECGDIVIAEFAKTRFGCCIYQIQVALFGL